MTAVGLTLVVLSNWVGICYPYSKYAFTILQPYIRYALTIHQLYLKYRDGIGLTGSSILINY